MGTGLKQGDAMAIAAAKITIKQRERYSREARQAYIDERLSRKLMMRRPICRLVKCSRLAFDRFPEIVRAVALQYNYYFCIAIQNNLLNLLRFARKFGAVLPVSTR